MKPICILICTRQVRVIQETVTKSLHSSTLPLQHTHTQCLIIKCFVLIKTELHRLLSSLHISSSKIVMGMKQQSLTTKFLYSYCNIFCAALLTAAVSHFALFLRITWCNFINVLLCTNTVVSIIGHCWALWWALTNGYMTWLDSYPGLSSLHWAVYKHIKNPMQILQRSSLLTPRKCGS